MTIYCFHRFLPSVLLQHVEDTMVISRLKWTVQTDGRVTAASTSILAILSGKGIVLGVCLLMSVVSNAQTSDTEQSHIKLP